MKKTVKLAAETLGVISVFWLVIKLAFTLAVFAQAGNVTQINPNFFLVNADVGTCQIGSIYFNLRHASDVKFCGGDQSLHSFTQPSAIANSTTIGDGTSTANLALNGPASAFSQSGLTFSHGGVNYDGFFDNLQSTPISANFATVLAYTTLFDYTDGVDRLESLNGPNAPLFIQPGTGWAGIGPYRTTLQMLTIGGNELIFDPSNVAATSLTNGSLTSGTSWTCTNDCTLASNAATWAFSAGTASTLTQTSGALAIPGVGNRAYKLTYTVSAVTGAPTASVTSAFVNTSSNDPNALYIHAGTQHTYFFSVGAPGNFVITSTLTAGQAFTLTNLSLQEVVAGSQYVGGVSYAEAHQLQDPVIVSALPTCSAATLYQRRGVTDANSLTLGGVATGGGTNKVAVECVNTGSAYEWVVD